jgi:type I restriction enzyme M protein
MATPAVLQYVRRISDAAKTLPRKVILIWLLLFKRICDQEEETRRSGAVHPRVDARSALFPAEDRLVIPLDLSWGDFRKLPQGLGEGLNAAFRAIEEANPAVSGLLACLDFSDRESFPDSVLRGLLASFDRLRLGASEIDEDTFGWMCEELMREVVRPARSSDPGFFTPARIARLLAEIIQPQEGMSIYDGACGTGGMLLECCRHLKRHKRNYESLRLYGQEVDVESWALCRINLLCHGIHAASIQRGDTLRDPRHLTGDGKALMTFDRVITYPSFPVKDWGFDEWSQGDRFGRAEYGVPPESGAGLAFLEHSSASLTSRGMLGFAAPQGFLSQTPEEGEIWQRLMQADLFEAIITLCHDAQSSSSLPTCLLIVNKAKARERRGKVLVVGASVENGLSDEAIAMIATVFSSYEDRPRFSRVVNLEELERNGYALNPSRYLQTGRAGLKTDIAAEWQMLQQLIARRDEAERKLAEQVDRLGLLRDDS